MAIRDFFASLFPARKTGTYVKFWDGRTPIFSQFGTNIYASDIVQNCIDRIATECSKLQPQHIRINADGSQEIITGSFNRLFKFSPNPLMTTRDFLEKTIWLLYLNYNAFIYPIYELKVDSQGYPYRDYKAFYPLNPNQVSFLQDSTDRIFIDLGFPNGDHYTMPYSDIIHLRKKFSMSDIMGGGLNGQPDNYPLLQTLDTNDVIIQGVGKAIKTSLNIRGIMKLNMQLDTPKQELARAEFEAKMLNSESGVLPVDLKGDFVQLTMDPKIIEKDTMAFIESKVLRWFGVSLPILSGDYTEDQYQAFYEQPIEPLMLSFGQAFSTCVFTQRQQDVGNEIVFYGKNLAYLSMKSKLELIKQGGEQGLFTVDQKLGILGYPPIGGKEGARRDKSLNYIDVAIANEYQMQSIKKQKEATPANA